MEWQQHEALEVLIISGVVVANVFPWGGAFAAALQGEEMKTARHKHEAKAYCEKSAMKHFAKLAHDAREFEPDLQDLNRRESAAREAKIAARMRPRDVPRMEF